MQVDGRRPIVDLWSRARGDVWPTVRLVVGGGTTGTSGGGGGGGGGKSLTSDTSGATLLVCHG